jgi:hypothetical protein
MRIEDEPDISFGNDGEEPYPQNVAELVAARGKELCSDEVYDERISLCRSCEHLRANELCDVSSLLVRIEARLLDSQCPVKKW